MKGMVKGDNKKDNGGASLILLLLWLLSLLGDRKAVK